MSTKELQQELAALVSKFESALSEAEMFAIEHKLSFRIDPCYGAGATFDGAEIDSTNQWGGETYGWFASSQSC